MVGIAGSCGYSYEYGCSFCPRIKIEISCSIITKMERKTLHMVFHNNWLLRIIIGYNVDVYDLSFLMCFLYYNPDTFRCIAEGRDDIPEQVLDSTYDLISGDAFGQLLQVFPESITPRLVGCLHKAITIGGVDSLIMFLCKRVVESSPVLKLDPVSHSLLCRGRHDSVVRFIRSIGAVPDGYVRRERNDDSDSDALSTIIQQ